MNNEPNGELRKQSRLQTIASVSLLFLPLLGFIWNQSLIIKTNADEIRALTSQAQHSVDERKQLQKDVESTKSMLSNLSEKYMVTEEKLKEVETQFDAIEQRSNNIRNEQVRWISVVWNKIPELGPFPLAPYSDSNISNRK